MSDLSIIIPTYNEKENLPVLIDLILKEYRSNKIDGEIIVVDDGSPDGTGEIADKFARKNKKIRVLHRKGKLGLSSAVLHGFSHAKSDVVGVIDSDLSHPANKIGEMFKFIREDKADLVIGSRYCRGGEIKGWGAYRKLQSRVANMLGRVFTDVEDAMSGFFLIKKRCLQGAELDSKGFKILLEVIVKAKCERIVEVPIIFVDRVKGKSKASAKEVFALLGNLIGYIPHRLRLILQAVKFGVVGLFGTITNTIFLYLLTEEVGIYYITSAVFAFIIAASQNYLLNKIWTFRENIGEGFGSKYFKFFTISVLGLIANLIVLKVFTDYLGIYYLVSNLFGIAAGMLINFIGNKVWTFKKVNVAQK